MTRVSPTITERNSNWIIVGILVVSLLHRWTLIFRGGQYYISDETRYEVSRDAARYLAQGQVGEALKQFTLSPEHLGFKVIGIIPALLEHITEPSLAMPAMFFSLFSILNLYLIFLLARRTSTSSSGPLYALALAALSHSLLYYSRHLFPYDMAMSFGLLALYYALAREQTTKRSLMCGGLGFLCFITYNGYWSLAGYAMLVNVLVDRGKLFGIVRKGTLTALGFVTPLGLLLLAMLWAGTDMLSAYRLFATTITQGSFDEGWSLPFVYFWYTEHTIILLLGALSLFALVKAFKDKQRNAPLWAGGVLFIYLCLLIPSVYMHYFVVYGRLARQMLPFLILLAAEGMTQLEGVRAVGRRGIVFIFVMLLTQAEWNFAESYRLAFPRDFVAEVQAIYPEFEFSSKRLAFGAPVICQNHGYIMENAKYYVDPPEIIPQVNGQLLLSTGHPSTFRPYQYDGDSPATRRAFDSLQLRMRFYKVDEQFMSETNPDWVAIKDCWIRDK
ncbi:MAG TPA: hypothetical protein VK897_10015 [Anaerolineales bacterium]|nr:hypothetical protein [Anaerolineales bacterium]